MLKRQITLNQACMDKDLPAKSRVLDHAESNPEFRKKLLDTYYVYSVFPYARSASYLFRIAIIFKVVGIVFL